MARDTSFYYSFLSLPREKRQAIVAVWDFCRAVDDAVDLVEDGGGTDPAARRPAAAALDAWRRDLELIYAGGRPGSTEARRLQPIVGRFDLPREPFELILEGVSMDLDAGRRFQTFADLRAYCYRVASAVGLVCVEIFGYRNPASRDYAVELGLALQLTNIARDIAPDLARGRLYVPLEDLARHGCEERDLAAGIVSGPVAALLKDQCDRARQHYRRAADTLPAEDARRLVAAEIMGRIYFALLREIERRGYDVFSRSVRVSRPRRAAIALGTWLRTMAGRPARVPAVAGPIRTR